MTNDNERVIGFNADNQSRKWTYEFPKKTLVRVIMQGNSSFIGYLSGESNLKQIYLHPCIVGEYLMMPDGKELPNYRFEDKLATIIDRGGVMAIQPISDNYLKRLPKVIFNCYQEYDEGLGI